MSDLLRTGSDWLAGQLGRHASGQVEYFRGDDSVTVNATVGRTEFEIDDGSGVLQRIEARDFLIAAGDLVLAGQAALPQRGDRIKESQNGTVYVYEVMAPGQEPHYRFSDPYRKLLRIHTKQVDTE